MNPLTNVKNITKLNEKELSLGIDSKTSWHNLYKHSAWIFLGGLSYDLTEGDIVCVFSQYGEVVNVNLVRDKKTGKSRGFCFVCYEDQRSTVLAVDNLNGIKLCGKTVRVDHVENYKIPKEYDDDDDLTKTLHLEGCAPKPPELSPNQEVKDVPKIKKEKKKKKDKKKKKESKKLSGRDSSSSNVSTKDIKPTNKEKEDKNDLGHKYLNKDTSSSYHNSPQKQKYENQSETLGRNSNIPVHSKLSGERSRETDLNHSSRHRSRSPLSGTQNSSRGSSYNKNFRKESPSDERKHHAKYYPKNGQEKVEEKRRLLKHRSWSKEGNKPQDEGKMETKNNDRRSSRVGRDRKEYDLGKRQRENDFYEQERSINQDYKGSKRFQDHRSRLSPLQGRFDELHHGRRDYEINLGFMNSDNRRYTEQQFNHDNGNSRYSERMHDTEDFTDRRRRDWEIGTSYTEREKELEWLRKREFEIQRERAREVYNFREECSRDFEWDDDFNHVPRNKSKHRTSYRPKDRSRSWNNKNSVRQPRISQR
ncbi:RNA-binding motif protein, X-linked 2-like isoform X2 [Limulus polyphemus]|uniref:RNA-binding motif protein, X-linked 2-like isoform X2 n=1 Tax=Limulus polyphemus TaxID=6850 RepID=A0ABM1BQW0_LIMPO|nr:RNA-binding motif protein, X-linked 2-like isoform X2 [Limulus polyphemus]